MVVDAENISAAMLLKPTDGRWAFAEFTGVYEMQTEMPASSVDKEEVRRVNCEE